MSETQLKGSGSFGTVYSKDSFAIKKLRVNKMKVKDTKNLNKEVSLMKIFNKYPKLQISHFDSCFFYKQNRINFTYFIKMTKFEKNLEFKVLHNDDESLYYRGEGYKFIENFKKFQRLKIYIGFLETLDKIH